MWRGSARYWGVERVVWVKRLTHNWTLKLAALGLALLLWASLRSDTIASRLVPGIPVEVRVADPDWVLTRGPLPDSVSVVFVGPWRELFRLALDRPRLVMVVEDVRDSIEVRSLNAGMIRVQSQLSDRIRVDDIRPASIRLNFDRVTSRLLPVAVRTRGTLPDGYEMLQPMHLDPPRVRVSGPRRQLQAVDSVRIPTIDLSRLTAPTTLNLAVETSMLEGLTVSPAVVDVFLPVVRIAPPPPPDSSDTAEHPDPPPADTTGNRSSDSAAEDSTSTSRAGNGR